MSNFRKKPVVIDAITWEELVEYGAKQHPEDAKEHNGLAWSFSYKGHPITHETDECYLIPTLEGTHNMTPMDMLITGVNGEIYPCKIDIFEKTYDKVETTFLERLKEEHFELNNKIEKLEKFIGSELFTKSVSDTQQYLLTVQLASMKAYSACLLTRRADLKTKS